MIKHFFNYISSKQNIYSSRKDLDTMRFLLLKKQLLYVYQNIPFYKKTFDESGLIPKNFSSFNELSSYPLITKDIVRKNFPLFQSKRSIPGNSFKSHTSGSTGQPMWTYYDLISWIRKKYLVKIRARMECGVKFGERIAILETSTPDLMKRTNRRFPSSFPFKIKYFSVFEPVEKVISSLQIFSPVSVYGSPSFFFRLSQLLNETKTQLPSIKRIFTSSEYLQENVRRKIEKNFNAGVFDVYGSTEFKEVAWECSEHEGYHINEDEVYVEVLQDGNPAAPGETGNLVITDLKNKLMPLIRFQLHDKGILLAKDCSCGRTFALMKPYAGRASEHIILPGGEILSPYLFTTGIEKIEGLHQYQIIQLKENTLLVKVITEEKEFEKVAYQIRSILSGFTGNLMKIDIEQHSKIDIEDNGKFKVIKNNLLNNRGELV